MYSPVAITRKYLQYYVTAYNGKGHGMHSPFVFQFILDVLHNRQGYAPPVSIEALRRQMLADKRALKIVDLGAGSRKRQHKYRTVGRIASSAVKPPKFGRMLYRLARHYQPANIIELGTSLGITTAYLASAHADAFVTTIEGSRAVREVAIQNFKALGLENIQSLEGNFDTVLPQMLASIPSIDLAFIDGNHRYDPTVSYFTQLLEKAHGNTIFVFDDIHWSAEMERAWAHIKAHPSVRCTIDLFFLGIVFLRTEFKAPQHFSIRF